MKKRAAKVVLSAAAMSAALAVSNPVDVYAAESDNIVAIAVAEDGFTVTEVAAILWTNANTSFLASPDDAAVIAPNVGAGLPVNVTGITSNGYFRIDLNGQVLYVNGSGLETGAVPAATAAVATAEEAATGWTPETVYNAIMALQSKYPEGMPWAYQEYTQSNIPMYKGRYACDGFVYHMWEDVFGLEYNWGSGNFGYLQSISGLKPGDLVVDNTGHKMIVLTVGNGYITVAEGNYNSTVHWGRKVKEKDLYEVNEELPECTGIYFTSVY